LILFEIFKEMADNSDHRSDGSDIEAYSNDCDSFSEEENS